LVAAFLIYHILTDGLKNVLVAHRLIVVSRARFVLNGD